MAARLELLAAEKELTRRSDELARRSLDDISRWWDRKLARLKAKVEDVDTEGTD